MATAPLTSATARIPQSKGKAAGFHITRTESLGNRPLYPGKHVMMLRIPLEIKGGQGGPDIE